MTTIEPGFRVGTVDFPDDYELKKWAYRGGEGDVWLATTARGDGDTQHRWALKILLAEHLEASHHETAAEAVQRWYLRAQRAMREVNQLEIPGVIGASDVFVGAPPHPPGEAGSSGNLYVVSKWIDGVNLPGWVQQGVRTFADVCDVAEQLARIVDAITTRPLAITHRDISPANVMVEDRTGAVKLIDFTFAVPVVSGPRTIVVNRGYTAPEARGGIGSAAADRYSFGAVIHYLLVQQAPPEHDAARGSQAALIRANHPEAVARHISSLLAEDPDQRPVSVVSWAEQLRELASAFDAPTGGPGWGEVDVVVDTTNKALVTAAGTTSVASASLATGALWSLVPDERAHAPRDPVDVRVACDGAGNVVHFVVGKSAGLWAGRSADWTRVGPATPAGGLAAVRLPHGSAAAFTIDPVTERLTTAEIRLDGRILRSTGGPYAHRVLAAVPDGDGRPAVVVTAADGKPVVAGADDPVRLGEDEVSVADICVNSWGDLLCLCAKAGSRHLAVFEQLYGSWTETAPIEAPGAVSGVACTGRRGGVAVAIAGEDGVWVANQRDGVFPDWHRLTGEPSRRVALEVGAAWRLHLAAVVAGQVVVATEDVSGTWSRGLKRL